MFSATRSTGTSLGATTVLLTSLPVRTSGRTTLVMCRGWLDRSPARAATAARPALHPIIKQSLRKMFGPQYSSTV